MLFEYEPLPFYICCQKARSHDMSASGCPRAADFCAGDRAVYVLSDATQQALRSTSNADPSAVLRDAAWARCSTAASERGTTCSIRAVAQPLGHNSPALITTYYLEHVTASGMRRY